MVRPKRSSSETGAIEWWDMNEGIALLEEIVQQLKSIHAELAARPIQPILQERPVDNQEQLKPSSKLEYLVEWLRENDQPELSTRRMVELIPFPVSHVLVGKARRELHATDV